MQLRRAWVEVDLGAVIHNLQQVKQKVGEGVRILVAVKAEAYGHGMVPVAKALAGAGVDYLGVAASGEGLRLREEGIATPILVFGSLVLREVKEILKYNLTLTAQAGKEIEELDRMSARDGLRSKVHIEVDTGMGRTGVWHEEADELVKKVHRLANIDLEGIYTHFPSADEPDKAFTHYQIQHFKALIQRLEGEGINIPYKHAANSAAVLDVESSYFNLVRPGLMVYGVFPSDRVSRSLDLRPVLSLKTTVAHLKKTPAGRSISYAREFVTPDETVIATLPVGYGDGYPHILSNRAHILIRGIRCPVVGRICMDQMMVDVGRVDDVKVGDEAVLIGSQGKCEVKAEELARECGTIPYQILCWINQGLPRVYKASKSI